MQSKEVEARNDPEGGGKSRRVHQTKAGKQQGAIDGKQSGCVDEG